MNASVVGVSEVEWGQTVRPRIQSRDFIVVTDQWALICPRSLEMDDDTKGRSLVGLPMMVGGERRVVFGTPLIR